MMQMTLTAFFEPAPEGGYTCGFEELPDVFSQGETFDEAKANLFDALRLVLEYHREESKISQGSEDVGTIRESFYLQSA